MRKAGLNPILSYRQSPPGVSGQAMAAVENLGLAGAQTGLMGAQSKQASSAAQLAREQVGLVRADTALRGAQTAQAVALERQANTQADLITQQLLMNSSTALRAQMEANVLRSPGGEALVLADMISKVLPSAGGLAGILGLFNRRRR